MFNFLNYGLNYFCMEEAGDDAGGSAGGDDAAAQIDTANEESAPDDAEAKDTGGSDGADDEANADKAKKESDDDAEKSKDDDDNGDEDEGTELLTADDFDMPEGLEVDEGMMGEFLEIANNKELSGKDRDQALVGLYAQKQKDALDAQYQSWDDQRSAWKTEAKTDKEIGGKAFDENLAHAQKAMAKFGSKELKEFGEQYGFMDNPEYLRMMVRVGKTLSEDNSSGNKGGGDSQTPIENRWYGSGDK
tara:strand:- start:2508 stop:3248 length:741 start_codon:yes stop_codon:yes gene_type:complete